MRNCASPLSCACSGLMNIDVETPRGGMINATFRGGPESDLVVVNVDAAAITPESGQLHVAVIGDEGSDHLMLLDNGAERPMENLLLTLGGGVGQDFAVAGSLVQVMNCEHVEQM